jgi:hypothetical protein
MGSLTALKLFHVYAELPELLVIGRLRACVSVCVRR